MPLLSMDSLPSVFDLERKSFSVMKSRFSCSDSDGVPALLPAISMAFLAASVKSSKANKGRPLSAICGRCEKLEGLSM